jgi:hypothetical protein
LSYASEGKTYIKKQLTTMGYVPPLIGAQFTAVLELAVLCDFSESEPRQDAAGTKVDLCSGDSIFLDRCRIKSDLSQPVERGSSLGTILVCVGHSGERVV